MKLTTAVVMVSEDEKSWEPILQENVPVEIKAPDVIGVLIAHPEQCAEHEDKLYRVVEVPQEEAGDNLFPVD